jgi:hypothetical protein
MQNIARLMEITGTLVYATGFHSVCGTIEHVQNNYRIAS